MLQSLQCIRDAFGAVAAEGSGLGVVSWVGSIVDGGVVAVTPGAGAPHCGQALIPELNAYPHVQAVVSTPLTTGAGLLVGVGVAGRGRPQLLQNRAPSSIRVPHSQLALVPFFSSSSPEVPIGGSLLFSISVPTDGGGWRSRDVTMGSLVITAPASA